IGQKDQPWKSIEPRLVGALLTCTTRPTRCFCNAPGKRRDLLEPWRVTLGSAAVATMEDASVARLPMFAPQLAAVAAHSRIAGGVGPLNRCSFSHGCPSARCLVFTRVYYSRGEIGGNNVPHSGTFWSEG